MTAVLVAGCAPLLLWMIGTVIVRITPPVYRSEALVKWPADSEALVRHLDHNPEVIEVAAAALAEGGIPTPMAGQALRTNLQLTSATRTGLVRIETTGRNPAEAQRTLSAVLDAYRHSSAGAPLVIYTPPVDSSPVEVSTGMRMVLGGAGLAMLGLLLSIPLLQRLERQHPLLAPRLSPAKTPPAVSVTAPACEAAVFPHDAGCLPAIRPAG